MHGIPCLRVRPVKLSTSWVGRLFPLVPVAIRATVWDHQTIPGGWSPSIVSSYPQGFGNLMWGHGADDWLKMPVRTGDRHLLQPLQIQVFLGSNTWRRYSASWNEVLWSIRHDVVSPRDARWKFARRSQSVSSVSISSWSASAWLVVDLPHRRPQ